MTSGETIKGKVKYDLNKESLQVIKDHFVRSYGARKVSSFQIIDEIQKITRTFYALPFSDIDGYENIHFFELLTEGKYLSLMTREEIVQKYHNQNNFNYTYNSINNQYRLELIYHFYFVNSKGQIKQLNKKKDEILSFMGSKREKIAVFIKTNKLRQEKKSDIIQIVDYYNSLRID